MILGPDGNPLLLGGGGYQIQRSLRFNSADAAYLYRTPGAAGNQRTWTLSAWVKRSLLGTTQYLFYATATARTAIRFNSTDTIYLCGNSGAQYAMETAQVFRDPAAWMHLVLAFNSTQATAANRIKLWVNGAQITAFTTETYPAQNLDGDINTAAQHGFSLWDAEGAFSGYLADVYLVDGLQLTPGSFGETDAATGQWIPKKYSGALGTCGCFLDFSDNSSTAALGYDKSRTNDWTISGFSVTAGAGNDSLADTPTNNYCTLNPVVAAAANIANGALASGTTAVRGTQDASLYNSYWEVTAGADAVTAGTIDDAGTASTVSVDASHVFGFRLASGALSYRNVTDAGEWTSIATELVGPQYPYGTSKAASWNFGQRAWAGAASGSALCTQNLTTPTIRKPSAQMAATLYTGSTSIHEMSTYDLTFQPDLVWIKRRDVAIGHFFFDSVRGVGKGLSSNTIAEEVTNDANGYLSAFTADGFTVVNGATSQDNVMDYDGVTYNYAAWCWKKGATPGVDIVGFIGTGSAHAENHSLGVAPEFVILKNRITAQDWAVWHKNLTSASYKLLLNAADAEYNGGAAYWNSTAPTSSVFSLGTDRNVNYSGENYVAYLFASVAGFSRFGSYIGNGNANGPFVWCGFRPRWIMMKRSDSSGNWGIVDTARIGYNVKNADLYANANSAEYAYDRLDIISNGFKIRINAAEVNANGGTFVFAAFAESPFKYANAR